MYKINTITKNILSFVIPKKYLIYHGKRKFKNVALTFDDGPNPEYTPQILDILDDYKVKATFFLIGREIEKYPALTRRILEKNHSIGNHSYYHKKHLQLDSRKIIKEIEETSKIIKRFNGHSQFFFRPPYGKVSLFLLFMTIRLNLSIVLWSVDSMDWKKESKHLILHKINSSNIRCGDIILFHDDNIFTVEALPIIIEGLKKKGYQFVTVEQMIWG